MGFKITNKWCEKSKPTIRYRKMAERKNGGNVDYENGRTWQLLINIIGSPEQTSLFIPSVADEIIERQNGRSKKYHVYIYMYFGPQFWPRHEMFRHSFRQKSQNVTSRFWCMYWRNNAVYTFILGWAFGEDWAKIYFGS